MHAHYRVLDGLLEGRQIIGFDWRYIYVNDAVARQGRKTKDELLGRTMMEVYPGFEQTDVFATLRRCMEARVSADLENQFTHPDGAVSWFELRMQPVPEGVFILSIEITERKRLEAEMRARNEELSSLFALSKHLRSAATADEMLRIALPEVQRIMHADGGAVDLLEPNNGHFTVAWAEGFLARYGGLMYPMESGLVGRVLRTREPVIVADYSALPDRRTDLVGGDEIGPVALALLHSETEPQGVIAVARRRGPHASPFSDSEARLLATVGEVMGIALRRLRLHADAERRLRHTQALRAIDLAIMSTSEHRAVLDVVLREMVTELHVDAADLLLLDHNQQVLAYAAGQGFRTQAIEQATLRLGEGHAGRAVLERRTLRVPDLNAVSDFVRAPLVQEEGFVAFYCVPLVAKDQVLGVLEVFQRAPHQPNPEWLAFLETLAGQAAIAIESAMLFDGLLRSNVELTQAYDATIEGWSRALDLRDKETEGHTLRVTETTLRLARAMGIGEADLIHVRRGALLHDIGKLGVPDAILLKPGKLTDEEWVVMRKHPVYAYELLSPIDYLKPALDIPYYHHEKWDGTGYPHGLSGEQIPLTARLFAVVDVWDALRSDRPYRPGWPMEKVHDYLRDQAWKHFDPTVVDVFLKLELQAA
jgi:putative nucleotidyltransferase with HDIG domain/PAS domain S-box-containing protein